MLTTMSISSVWTELSQVLPVQRYASAVLAIGNESVQKNKKKQLTQYISF